MLLVAVGYAMQMISLRLGQDVTLSWAPLLVCLSREG